MFADRRGVVLGYPRTKSSQLRPVAIPKCSAEQTNNEQTRRGYYPASPDNQLISVNVSRGHERIPCRIEDAMLRETATTLARESTYNQVNGNAISRTVMPNTGSTLIRDCPG